ncbi:hypothetical protein L7F22_034464 [Adiantum nelumboides]|nr:hypothetical protein [Adiantum nelumboides]
MPASGQVGSKSSRRHRGNELGRGDQGTHPMERLVGVVQRGSQVEECSNRALVSELCAEVEQVRGRGREDKRAPEDKGKDAVEATAFQRFSLSILPIGLLQSTYPRQASSSCGHMCVDIESKPKKKIELHRLRRLDIERSGEEAI